MKNTIKSDHDEALTLIALECEDNGIKELFLSEDCREKTYSYDVPGLYIDFSKTHLKQKIIDVYKQIAADIDFKSKRHNLFSGVKINSSEHRAVLHTLLRDPSNQGIQTVDSNYEKEAQEAKKLFSIQFRQIEKELSERKIPIEDIIHVGIGGSSLGTRLVYESLRDIDSKISVHFISNIDAHELLDVLQHCDAKTTMVIGVSKTFKTAETLSNIRSIGKWFIENGVDQYLSSIYAVTANSFEAEKFGINTNNIITFPEWVGGRYSVWSSVSISAAIAVGFDKFQEFLIGAAEVDKYFYLTESDKNACFISAALDHFYTNYFGTSSKAIFAYDYRLRSLVNYLQQLETESNGKDRQIDGEPVDQKTSPVVWGGIGTDVQHSVFQMLHQGTSTIPAEFILVSKAKHEFDDNHVELLANGIAQTAALLAGQDLDTVLSQNKLSNSDKDIRLAKASIFSGDRPSTTILIDELSPKTLGSLLAFYEHRTFCYGVFSNINSFDQMGVELGKRLAKKVKPMLNSNGEKEDGFNKKTPEEIDPSSAELINKIINYNKK